MIEPTSHFAVSSVPECEIQDDDDKCCHEEGIEDNENIFYIFED